MVRWLLLSFRLPNRKPSPSSLHSVEQARLQQAEVGSGTVPERRQHRKDHNTQLPHRGSHLPGVTLKRGVVHSSSFDGHNSILKENHLAQDVCKRHIPSLEMTA